MEQAGERTDKDGRKTASATSEKLRELCAVADTGKTEITNMVMVQDRKTGKVLVQKRVKYWCGYAFPGGHLEPGESLYGSAVREVREETGLEIRNLKACGTVYWYNLKTGDRYFVYLYKTVDFTGDAVDGTEEGAISWVTLDDLRYRLPTPPNFQEYLPVFLEDSLNEAFCAWNPDSSPDLTQPNPWGITYF